MQVDDIVITLRFNIADSFRKRWLQQQQLINVGIIVVNVFEGGFSEEVYFGIRQLRFQAAHHWSGVNNIAHRAKADDQYLHVSGDLFTDLIDDGSGGVAFHEVDSFHFTAVSHHLFSTNNIFNRIIGPFHQDIRHQRGNKV